MSKVIFAVSPGVVARLIVPVMMELGVFDSSG